jgi:hypothetical protein
MKPIAIPKWPLIVAALLVPAALQAQAGQVVCKDGSNGSNVAACASHGGVDSVSTAAAKKARGGVETGQLDTARGAKGMGPDTTLKAKPGVQTGPAAGDTGAMSRDTSKSKHSAKSKKHHHKTTADSTHMRADSAAMRPDSAH